MAGDALVGTAADLVVLQRLIVPTLANAVVIVSAYLAAASLVWGFADATMEQPLDLSRVRRRAGGAPAGASRISPTFTSLASATASASKAAVAARAAMTG